MADPATAVGADLIEALNATITHPEFPCLGARSVFRQNRATVRVHDELGSPASADQLLEDLSRFAFSPASSPLFRGPHIDGEQAFESFE